MLCILCLQSFICNIKLVILMQNTHVQFKWASHSIRYYTYASLKPIVPLVKDYEGFVSA